MGWASPTLAMGLDTGGTWVCLGTRLLPHSTHASTVPSIDRIPWNLATTTCGNISIQQMKEKRDTTPLPQDCVASKSCKQVMLSLSPFLKSISHPGTSAYTMGKWIVISSSVSNVLMCFLSRCLRKPDTTVQNSMVYKNMSTWSLQVKGRRWINLHHWFDYIFWNSFSFDRERVKAGGGRQGRAEGGESQAVSTSLRTVSGTRVHGTTWDSDSSWNRESDAQTPEPPRAVFWHS